MMPRLLELASWLATTRPVVVVGSGLAGVATALRLCELGQPVWLCCKGLLNQSNSAWAQGGIAFSPHEQPRVPFHPDDSLAQHVEDTLTAGVGHNQVSAVQAILAESPQALATLQRWGVVFDSEEGESAETKRFALTQEGAHRYPRILHAGGDQTGRHVMAHLLKQLQAQPLFTYSEGVELLAMEATEQGGYRLTLAERASQQLCRENEDETACVLEGMPSVVLATGGVGGLFAATTNTPFATGDALALARMLEVPLTDVPFVQFHPTAFVHQGQVRFLVSEALRGEGAILRNVRGEAFAKRYHPQGDLAPRDVVARMMIREIAQQQATDAQAPAHVFLDMTHRAPQWLEQRFPSIVAMAREYGVCPARQWLPVVPAAHYHMGGVATDVAGRTQRAGLFVVGEAACTGLHGANRLASNSLLECVIMGLNCADAIMTQASVSDSPLEMSPPMSIHPCVDVMTIVESGLPTVAQLQACVQESLGIERRRSVLVQAQNQLIAYLHTCQQVLSEGCSIAALRRQRQVQTAFLLVEAALQTPQSLGAHCFVEDVFLPDSATSGMSS